MKIDAKSMVKEVQDQNTHFQCNIHKDCPDHSMIVIHRNNFEVYRKMCKEYYKAYFKHSTYESVALIDFTEEYILIHSVHES